MPCCQPILLLCCHISSIYIITFNCPHCIKVLHHCIWYFLECIVETSIVIPIMAISTKQRATGPTHHLCLDTFCAVHSEKEKGLIFSSTNQVIQGCWTSQTFHHSPTLAFQMLLWPLAIPFRLGELTSSFHLRVPLQCIEGVLPFLRRKLWNLDFCHKMVCFDGTAGEYIQIVHSPKSGTNDVLVWGTLAHGCADLQRQLLPRPSPLPPLQTIKVIGIVFIVVVLHLHHHIYSTSSCGWWMVEQ